jgi:MFS family permease
MPASLVNGTRVLYHTYHMWNLFAGIDKRGVLFPVAFSATMALGCTSFGVAFYAKDILSAGPAVVGQFAGVWALSYIAGCLSLNFLSRSLLPRWSLFIALSGMGLFLGLMLAVRHVASALALFGLYGLATALFFPPLVTWLTAGVESAELGKTTSRFAVAWSIGGVVAPWVSSRLMLIDRRAPILFSVSVFALAAGYLLLANLLFPLIRGDRDAAASPAAGAARDGSTALRFPAWILLYTCYALNGLIMNHFPVYMRDALGVRTESIGTMYLIRSAVLTLLFALLGRFVVWHFKRRLFIIASAVALASAALLMFFTSEAMLLSALVLSSLALGLAYNSSIFYAVAGARNRQKRTAINESILNAGSFSGAVGSGFLLERFSMPTVVGITALALAAGSVAQSLLLVRGKTSKRNP